MKGKIVVEEGIRQVCRERMVHMQADVVPALNKYVTDLVNKSIDRARGNNRTTLMSIDLGL